MMRHFIFIIYSEKILKTLSSLIEKGILTSKDIKKEIRDWSRHALEVPNPDFNNLPPCPYAQAAWQEDKVEIVFKEYTLNSTVTSCTSTVKPSTKQSLKFCLTKTGKSQQMSYLIVMSGSNEYCGFHFTIFNSFFR